jgi:hypothetical protein
MRRVPTSALPGGVVPPAEMLSYLQWCASRGLAPFGIAGDVVSLRSAFAQWEVWEAQRGIWAAAHGCEADDLDMTDEGGAPFDPDL